MVLELILTGLLQGLLLAFIACGVMIPFRILNFPDLTAEGSYPLGGAVCASMIILGVYPFFAIIIAAMLAGTLGIFTAFVHLRYKVNTILSGVIISTIIYSFTLRLMGKPNIGLFDHQTLLTESSMNMKILLVLGVFIFFISMLYLFLNTEMGLRIRSVGLNPDFAARSSVNIASYSFLGLFLGNAYIGFAGGLMVQVQNYMDIGMGTGIVIHAIAALMIGESIIGNKTLSRQLLAPFVGALVYQQIQGLVLFMGMPPSDLKLLTGGLVLTIIVLKYKSQSDNLQN